MYEAPLVRSGTFLELSFQLPVLILLLLQVLGLVHVVLQLFPLVDEGPGIGCQPLFALSRCPAGHAMSPLLILLVGGRVR